MAKAGEGIDHFGMEMALDTGAEERGEGVVEIAGDVDIGGEVAADLGAGVDGEAAPRFALFVEEYRDAGHLACGACCSTATGAIVGN